jgi:hypothetical protein
MSPDRVRIRQRNLNPNGLGLGGQRVQLATHLLGLSPGEPNASQGLVRRRIARCLGKSPLQMRNYPGGVAPAARPLRVLKGTPRRGYVVRALRFEERRPRESPRNDIVRVSTYARCPVEVSSPLFCE